MTITFEKDYTGIIFGFSFYPKQKELVLAFLFWGLVINLKNK
jgi:hypothetical protein